jgi:hypothetical protein
MPIAKMRSGRNESRLYIFMWGIFYSYCPKCSTKIQFWLLTENCTTADFCCTEKSIFVIDGNSTDSGTVLKPTRGDTFHF